MNDRYFDVEQNPVDSDNESPFATWGVFSVRAKGTGMLAYIKTDWGGAHFVATLPAASAPSGINFTMSII